MDTKEAFRSRKFKRSILYNSQKEITTIETKIYKTRHRELNTEQHEHNINQDVHTGLIPKITDTAYRNV